MKTRNPASWLRFAILFAASSAIQITVSLADTYTWNLNASGPSDWNNNSSWTPNTGFPDAIDDVANLNNDISTNNAIGMGAPVTVGSLNIGDLGGNNRFTINPGSALTFSTPSIRTMPPRDMSSPVSSGSRDGTISRAIRPTWTGTR